MCGRAGAGGGRAVSLRSARPRYDPWRDIDGGPIPDGCRVEQVALAKEHGAVSRRLGKRGVVVGRVRGVRLRVLFDDEAEPVTIRPLVVRVVPVLQGGGR